TSIVPTGAMTIGGAFTSVVSASLHSPPTARSQTVALGVAIGTICNVALLTCVEAGRNAIRLNFMSPNRVAPGTLWFFRPRGRDEWPPCRTHVSSDGNTTAVDCAAARAPKARTIGSAAQLTQNRDRMALVIYCEVIGVSRTVVVHEATSAAPMMGAR